MTILKFSKSQMKGSMLTGVPQIIQARGTARKVLKSLVLVTSLIGCLYQICSYMEVYWEYPVIVDVIVSNPRRITLPAFTVCEYNGIKRSKFCNAFPELCTPNKSFQHFCTRYSVFCKDRFTEPENIMMPAVAPQELPLNFSDLRYTYKKMGSQEFKFVDGAYHGDKYLESRSVSVFNHQGLPTNCFAYNTVWGNVSAVLTKDKYRKGFQISLEMGGSENFYLSTPIVIQMAVHSPFMKVNPFTDGFSVRPCTTYKMYLQKTVKIRLPAPYPTNCTDYQKLWKERGGYGPLNQEMCIKECAFNRSIEIASCFNPEDVTYPNDDAPFCFDGPDLEKVFEVCELNCQPACYEEDMTVKIEEFVFSFTEVQKEKDTCKTGIELSFIQTQVMTFAYKTKYQVVEAFGYVGGFLGMWLGLSLIAVCDFIETCLTIILYACKKRTCFRRQNKNNIMKMKMMQQHKILFM